MSGEPPQISPSKLPVEQESLEPQTPEQDTGGTVDLEDKHIDTDQPITKKVDRPETEPTRRWGTLLASDHAQLLLHVQGAEKPLRVDVRERVVVGRGHVPSGFAPDIDLEPYDAHRKGVSRQHLAITFCDHMLQVEDLRSANGTLLNGWVLMPHEPRVLRDGDQLMMGRLSMIVTVIAEAETGD